MNFFPNPYPDEVLYSTLARYCIRSGNPRDVYNFEDLFGTRNSMAVMELPTQLDSLIDNMPIGAKYTAEYFIYQHTLFPFIAAFFPAERAKGIIHAMRNKDRANTYTRAGLLNVELNRYFRFCPECFREDIEKYGEPYWHRIHQVTGVFVCSKHNLPLHNSKQLVRGGSRQRYIGATHKNCVIDEEINYSDNFIEKMLWMAQDVEWLLSTKFEFKGTKWFKSQFRVMLVEKGYAHMNNYVNHTRLKEDFMDYYGEEYLNLLQSPLSINNWLSNLVVMNDRTTYAIRYLLLARFLEIPVYDLFNTKLGFDDEEDIIQAYQDLWDERLVELIESGLSLTKIAGILKTTRNTIKKSVKKLGIEPFWEKTTFGKYYGIDYSKTEEFKAKREDSRRKWIELHDKYKEKSSYQLRSKDYGLYFWLRNNDREWFNNNYRRIEVTYSVFNWDKRDAELLPKVKEIIKEMKTDKPERITWLTIGSKLGINGTITKSIDKLPMTKSYVEPEIESLEEYHIRRIKWGIEELKRQGRAVTLWNLSDVSGVKPWYMEKVSEEIYQELRDKKYDFDNN